MITNYIVLCFFFYSHDAWGAPASGSISADTQLSGDFNKNLGLMMNNIHSGVSNAASKPMNFGFNIMPSMVSQGSKTATEKLNKISDANNEALGKIGVGLGHAVGSAGVSLSSLGKGGLNIAGSGMGVANNMIETGAISGINLAGKMGDKVAAGKKLGGTLGQSALTAVGDGMKVTSGGIDVLTQRTVQIIDALGQTTAQGMNKAELALEALMNKGTAFMGGKVTSTDASMKMQYYKSMKSLLDIMTDVQKMFDNMSSMVISTSTDNAGHTTTAATTGTAEHTAPTGATKSIKNTRGVPEYTTRDVSAGTQLSDDFNKNLAVIMNNIHSGVTNAASKPIKLTYDILPSIIQQGTKTATDKINKIVSANNEALGKIGVGLGHAGGSAGVLLSSLGKGGLNIAGSGMGAANNIIETGAISGINLAGKVGDKIAAGMELGGTLGQSTLTAVGDGMKVTAGGIDVLAQGMVQIIDALGQTTAQGMNKAELALEALMNKGTAFMGGKVTSINASMQMQYYKGLKSLLDILIDVNKIFDNMSSMLTSTSTDNAGEITTAATTGSAEHASTTVATEVADA